MDITAAKDIITDMCPVYAAKPHQVGGGIPLGCQPVRNAGIPFAKQNIIRGFSGIAGASFDYLD